MRTFIKILLNIVLCGAFLGVMPVGADEERVNSGETVEEHWLKVSQSIAEGFVFEPASNEDPAKRFHRYEHPVFRHAQPARGNDIGSVYLWLAEDKRPAVICTVFAWSDSETSRAVCFEAHSLTTTPLQLTSSDKRLWTSPTPGIEWKAFSHQVPPAVDDRRRKIQARQLSRQLTASTTSPDNQRTELRSIATPIYEYSSASAAISYGAVFALCDGTDTEVILMLEEITASPTNSEQKPGWRYSLVPFTDYKVQVEYNRKQVWESPPVKYGEDGKPHMINYLESQPKPTIEVSKQQ